MPPKGKTGVSTSGMEYSPTRIKRMKRAQVRQEERWAKRAGKVRSVTPVGRCGCGRWLYDDQKRDSHECVDP